jgi:hypothetical protein
MKVCCNVAVNDNPDFPENKLFPEKAFIDSLLPRFELHSYGPVLLDLWDATPQCLPLSSLLHDNVTSCGVRGSM